MRAKQKKTNGSPKAWEGRICGECQNAYDWHNKAVDGHMTLARCPYREWCVIYGEKACEKFKDRKKS